MADTATPLDVAGAVSMPSDLAAINYAGLATIGALAIGNVTTIHKVLDNDYMENHRLVSIVQALGAREVTSKQVPGGPYSPAVAPNATVKPAA